MVNTFYPVLLLVTSFFVNNSHAMDVAKLQVQKLSKSKAAYKIDIIQRALQVTEAEYGEFTLDVVDLTMSGQRIFQSSLEGGLINTIIQPRNELLDQQHLVIRIPVRLGLLNYRLLLIDKSDVGKYEKVETLTDLNHFKAGLGGYWETTKVYKKNRLNMLEVSHIPNLFSMLQKQRFDYLPRGLYEIYDELDSHHNKMKTIVIEPTIALHIPMYTYVYVSPKAPRLANRLQVGLHSLLVSGELKKILYDHYADDIQRSNLPSRKVISIESNAYPHYNSEYDKYLLFKSNSTATRE